LTPRIYPQPAVASKKSTGLYSAQRAELGARTLKTGQSRWFVGYKKHTLRLWLHDYKKGILLVPLVSWVAPANRHEGGFLTPSLRHCQRQWQWCPPLIVADMGYLGAEAKRQSRELWQVAVLTKLRSDMKLVAPYTAWNEAACPEGEPLAWLGYDHRQGEHWFGVGVQPELCGRCWQAARCPREFSFRPAEHETLLGLLPLASRSAQYLLQQARPWIEPAQSFEKNQLGLGAMFLNSLRLTWIMSLLADTAVLPRTKAILSEKAVRRTVLADLMSEQMTMNFEVE
jgi:hypothetical protein